MCGLAGILSAGGETGDALRAQVGAMSERLRHRGPDDAGLWVDAAAGIAFGFRRLSIVDLSPAGHQPMSSASGRFTIVFNGEVFNARDLARELSRHGVQFRGHSDTEVMLAAFECWGVEASVRRFVGMFAFALWDAQCRRLHLCRDRLGKKPLFVHHGNGRVTFASELKALISDPHFDRRLNPDAVASYLEFFYVPAGASIFQGTIKLPPGSILTIDDASAALPDPVTYWSVQEEFARAQRDPFVGTPTEAIDETERLLTEAIRLRMEHADVPVGAFLSGGIDSTTVVALMQHQTTRPVRTYTIGFREQEYAEQSHAEAVARELGTLHRTLVVTADDALSLVPELVEVFDEPFADISQIPSLLVSRLAREDVTVALSGDGGDEVFGGYNRYVWGGRLYPMSTRMPRPLRRALSAGLTAVSPAGWDRTFRATSRVLPKRLRYRLPGEKVHKIGALLRQDGPSDFYRSLIAAWQRPEAKLESRGGLRGTFEAVMDSGDPASYVDRMMLTDLLTYLPDNNLAKVDRASMAVSLEVRVPLLDHRLVEFSFRLPLDMKIREGQTKWALRQVLYRHVPRALVEREKMGFDAPIGAWLRGPLRDWASDLLAQRSADDDSLLDLDRVRRAWREHLDERANHGLSLWVVLMLLAWRAHWKV
jgi:asparagine synthase (glutamine-hydrolysing)